MIKHWPLLLLSSLAVLAKDEAPKLVYKEFHGLRADDPTALNGLRNPERGFRLECPVGLGDGQLLVQRADGRVVRRAAPAAKDEKPVPFLGVDVARTGWTDRQLFESLKAWELKGVTTHLGICWLDEYHNRALDQIIFQRLEKSLDAFRRAGCKLELRFAYELDDSKSSGPDLAMVKGHWAQLKKILAANADVLIAVQLGSIGRRGEGANATKIPETPEAHGAILKEAFASLPNDRALLVQSPDMREGLCKQLDWPLRINQGNAFEKGNPTARLGTHNTRFLFDLTHDGSFDKPLGGTNEDWQKFCMENLFVPYDAEITAKTATQPTAVDGWLVAQVASNERAFALGLAHGWSEADPAKTPGLVDGWKKQMKTQAEVTQLNLPISEGYFTDTKGNAVSRSAFDYLRDHVGYRYELLSASWQNKVKLGAKFDIKIRIANRGFSACPTPRGLDLAYVDSPTKYTLSPGEGEAFDIRRLPPYVVLQNKEAGYEITIKATAPKDIQPGKYQICVMFPEIEHAKLKQDARHRVRFANRDAPFWQSKDGKLAGNLMGEIEFAR
jgi:hypothetical protein